MKFLTTFVFLLVALLSVFASSNSGYRPKHLHGQRARYYCFLMVEYKKMLSAQESLLPVEFLDTISHAYTFDQELRRLCHPKLSEVRDFTCIDYSRLRKRIFESCTFMFSPVMELMKNVTYRIMDGRDLVSERIESLYDSNAEITIVLFTIRQFPNAFDPGVWIQACRFIVQQSDLLLKDARKLVHEADILLELIELYKSFIELSADQMEEHKSLSELLEKQKRKLELSIDSLELEKDKHTSFIADLSKIRDK